MFQLLTRHNSLFYKESIKISDLYINLNTDILHYGAKYQCVIKKRNIKMYKRSLFNGRIH